MTCVRVVGGLFNGAILTIADQSEPFFHKGKRYAVDKRWGPFACDEHGDPLKNQPSGRKLQAAYEFHMTASRVECI